MRNNLSPRQLAVRIGNRIANLRCLQDLALPDGYNPADFRQDLIAMVEEEILRVEVLTVEGSK